MSKTKVEGNWILTREKDTPDSERHLQERDDVFFPELQKLFQGQKTTVDFKAIAAAKDAQPEDVFMRLHENYGYICIGTGENPAINEKLTDEQKLQRQKDIERMLDEQKLPHILVKGKYMGVEENSYFIPFNNNNVGLAGILQSEIIQKVDKIAGEHHQDSLLICQNGYACYLYTTGPQKGNVVAGRSAVVYPEASHLPDDCYSQFVDPNNHETIAFTCVLDFNHVYTDINEFAAAENKILQDNYSDFLTTWDENPSGDSSRKKVVVILRGTNGYNDFAVKMKQALAAENIKTEIFGSDANIAKINEEIPGADWPTQVLPMFLSRNTKIYDNLMSRDDVDVVIYSDMNKLLEFMLPYIKKAGERGYEVVSNVVNSFVFDPKRSDYSDKLSNQYGSFMPRHLADFKSEKSQINADKLKTDAKEVDQYHSLPVDDFVKLIAGKLIANKQSAAALTSGLTGAVFSRGNSAAKLDNHVDEEKAVLTELPAVGKVSR